MIAGTSHPSPQHTCRPPPPAGSLPPPRIDGDPRRVPRPVGPDRPSEGRNGRRLPAALEGADKVFWSFGEFDLAALDEAAPAFDMRLAGRALTPLAHGLSAGRERKRRLRGVCAPCASPVLRGRWVAETLLLRQNIALNAQTALRKRQISRSCHIQERRNSLRSMRPTRRGARLTRYCEQTTRKVAPAASAAT